MLKINFTQRLNGNSHKLDSTAPITKPITNDVIEFDLFPYTGIRYHDRLAIGKNCSQKLLRLLTCCSVLPLNNIEKLQKSQHFLTQSFRWQLTKIFQHN